MRIDVDTFRDPRYGVVKLLDILAAYNIRASFFFSVGPDNMGRHLWRLLRPAFLKKMLRSKAAHLYGWDIVLRGTLWLGPIIGERPNDIIQATAGAGHEIGLHAWDYHAWQVNIDSVHRQAIRQSLTKGVAVQTRILGRTPTCSAAVCWKCTEKILLEKMPFAFTYNSDCRGQSIFRPLVNGTLCSPQIPVTLPTYDEVIGRNGITTDNYNDALLALVQPHTLNVLAIHAEVEGIGCADLFSQFLHKAPESSIVFLPLGAFCRCLTAFRLARFRPGKLPVVKAGFAGSKSSRCPRR